jgi:hypothetical protein
MLYVLGALHGVVAKAQRYKPESRRSNPESVIGIFRWYNFSGCTMALGSNHPLTEMSTRYIYWGVKVAGPWGLPPSCGYYPEMWEHQTTGTIRPCAGITLSLPSPWTTTTTTTTTSSTTKNTCNYIKPYTYCSEQSTYQPKPIGTYLN